MGMDKPYELIEEIVLAEDVVSIVRNNWDLKRIMIFGEIPKAAAAAALVIEINSGSTLIGYWYASGAIAIDYQKQIRISCEKTEIGFVAGGCVGNSQSATQKVMPYNWLSTTGHIQTTENITKIAMYPSGASSTIPAGTKFQIYGVRA